jgi:hypothetical protein
MFFAKSKGEAEVPAGIRGRQPGRLNDGCRLGTHGDGSRLAHDASRPATKYRSRDHRPSAKPASQRPPTSSSIRNQQSEGAASDRVPSPRQPGQPLRPSAEPIKRTRASRDTFIGTGALVILAGVICCVSWGGPSESKPAAETAPVPLALRSSLTAAQQGFVDQVSARYDLAKPQGERVLKIGNDVCGMLSTGSTVGYIPSTITGIDSALSPGDANSLVNLAAQDLCPGIIPVPSPAGP